MVPGWQVAEGMSLLSLPAAHLLARQTPEHAALEAQRSLTSLTVHAVLAVLHGWRVQAHMAHAAYRALPT